MRPDALLINIGGADRSPERHGAVQAKEAGEEEGATPKPGAVRGPMWRLLRTLAFRVGRRVRISFAPAVSQVRTCLAREFAFLGASDALTVTERSLVRKCQNSVSASASTRDVLRGLRAFMMNGLPPTLQDFQGIWWGEIRIIAEGTPNSAVTFFIWPEMIWRRSPPRLI
jgi:hypothetical protein